MSDQLFFIRSRRGIVADEPEKAIIVSKKNDLIGLSITIWFVRVLYDVRRAFVREGLSSLVLFRFGPSGEAEPPYLAKIGRALKKTYVLPRAREITNVATSTSGGNSSSSRNVIVAAVTDAAQDISNLPHPSLLHRPTPPQSTPSRLHRHQPEVLVEKDAQPERSHCPEYKTNEPAAHTMSNEEITSSVVEGIEALCDNFFL
ncbi:hypothetical protein V8E52_010680 [Russula decolorans]